MGPGTDSDHQFALWHPRLTVAGDAISAIFDVTPGEVYSLNEGSTELIAALLATLGVIAAPCSWNVQRFCTQYYADDGGGSYRDRLTLAWRVSVTATGTGVPFNYGGLGPFYFRGYDPTADTSATQLHWNPTERTIVIADLPDDALADLNVPGKWPTELVLLDPSGTGLRQLRVRPGTLRYPEQEDIVTQLAQHLQDTGAGTSWLDAYTGPAGRLSRDVRAGLAAARAPA